MCPMDKIRGHQEDPLATNSERLPLTREDLRQEHSLFRDEVLTHYATKGDLAELKGELKAELSVLEVRLTKWMVSLMIGSVVAASTVAVLIERLTG